jgi:hypothetical protein
MLDLEAFGDWSDPQGISGAMDYVSVAQCLDTSITVLVGMALPDPASVFTFDDLTDEAFFEACCACACVEVFWAAAHPIVASLQDPITPRDWSYPNFMG